MQSRNFCLINADHPMVSAISENHERLQVHSMPTAYRSRPPTRKRSKEYNSDATCRVGLRVAGRRNLQCASMTQTGTDGTTNRFRATTNTDPPSVPIVTRSDAGGSGVRYIVASNQRASHRVPIPDMDPL